MKVTMFQVTYVVVPLSDFKIDGYSWGHPIIFFGNWGILLILYGIWFWRKNNSFLSSKIIFDSRDSSISRAL